MKVFLTGGNGFAASQFIRKKRNSYELSYSVRNRSYDIKGASKYVLDLEKSSGWEDALRGCDAVLHMAAIAHSKNCDLQKLYSVNVKGSEILAKACIRARVKRFIFISSIGVHGQFSDSLICEQSRITPHDPYTNSKYEAELKLREILSGSGVELIILRPSLIYGEGAHGSFGFLTKVVLKLGITPFGLANNKKQFLGIDNFISIIDRCINLPNINGQVFVCADRNSLSLKSIIEVIATSNCVRVIQLPIPIKILRISLKLIGKKKLAEQLFSNFEVDTTNAEKVLSWTPMVSMKCALKNKV